MKKIALPVLSIAVLALVYLIFNTNVQVSGAAGMPLSRVQEAEVLQSGPTWFDPAWNYRQAITIFNSGEELTDYQVLIKLNSSNFDFSKAKANGADVRFTKGDGTTLIDYWIEPPWNSTLTYIWVEVPVIQSGNTTIYLYYNNPSVGTVSNGTETFVFFDDEWNQFKDGGCSAGIPWDCISPGATVSSGNLVLLDNTGITSHLQFSQKAVGYSAKFGSGNGLESGGFINGASGPRSIIRDLPTDADDLYLQDYAKEIIDNNPLERVQNVDWHNQFHVFEIRRWVDVSDSGNNKSIGEINHGASIAESMIASEVPTDTLSISFNNAELSTGVLRVDWVYVREYRNPEPVVSVGAEQGLVDLQVSMHGSSDTLYAGEQITYTIAISNTSSIDAPGVVLTDTLPVGVSFVSANPSQGNCTSEVICDLGTIAASSDVQITIVANTTMDGNPSNTAVVDSLGYDWNYDDNTDYVETTVLPSADLAVTLQGYPDAVLPAGTLTYIITVSNQGPSAANSVQVVETLPSGVAYQNSSPNICTPNGGNVTCQLSSPLASGAETQINISTKVQSSTTGFLYSNASVNSGTHEPNPANNNSMEQNLLDATKPSVAWVRPVTEVDDTYQSQNAIIPLEASANDMVEGSDQIAWVEFYYWDHLYDGNGDGIKEGRYVAISTATSSPYQVDFDSVAFQLVRSEFYQVFVRSYDRAGNVSDRQRIFIEVLPYNTYIPLIKKH